MPDSTVDPWEQAAQSYKKQPQPAGSTPASAPANEDWKVWQSNGGGQPQQPGFFSRLYEGTVQPLVGLGQDYIQHNQENYPKDGMLSGFHALGQTVLDAGNGMTDTFLHAAHKTAGAAKKGDVLHTLQQAPGMVPILGPSLVKSGEDVEQGNYSGAAGDALAAVINAKAPELIRGATKLPAALKSLVKVNPEVATEQAWRPGPNDSSFPKVSPQAVREIKTFGNPDASTNGDTLAGAKPTIAKLQGGLDTWIDRAQTAGVTIPGDEIVAATQKAIPDLLWTRDPETARALVSDAQKAFGGRQFTPAQFRDWLKTENGSLQSFYSGSSARQGAAEAAGTAPAIEKAQAQAMRDLLYRYLDPEGEGAGPRSIQERTGSVINLRNAADRRSNAITGEKGVTPLAGLSNFIGAGLRLIGSPLNGGFSDALGRFFHPMEGPSDALIGSLYKQSPKAPLIPLPEEEYPRTPTTRQLTAGSIKTPPPPDTSGPIPGGKPVPGFGLSPNTRLLLGPGREPIITPAPADTSGPLPVHVNPEWSQPGVRNLLPPPSRVQSSGFATGTTNDLIPVKHPVTGQIEYIPDWMLQENKPPQPGK